jgi:hypothetical protein
LESLLDAVSSKDNHDIRNDGNDDNDENNDKNHINIVEKDTKQSHIILAKETAEALLQELKQKVFISQITSHHITSHHHRHRIVTPSSLIIIII